MLLDMRRQIDAALEQIQALKAEANEAPQVCEPLSTDQQVRQCIAQLMELTATDAHGHERPVFHKAAHWQAVYRILVDNNLGTADGDFKGFERWVPCIAPPDCRIPFSYQALRDISKTPFVRPFAKWRFDNSYFRTRTPYDSMYRVASEFLRILTENGVLKR